MSTENERTVEFYNQYADLYHQRNLEDYATPRGVRDDQIHQAYILKTLERLPKTAKMFEIGSGYGRDAKRIEELGYHIQVSDVAESFLKILRKEGFAPRKFDIVNDDFVDTYDYILANAVFVHLTKEEVVAAVRKIYQALNNQGIFALSLKQRLGGGEEWKANISGTKEKRYFSYWEIGEATAMLEATGFEVTHCQQNGGMRACWLDIITRKN